MPSPDTYTSSPKTSELGAFHVEGLPKKASLSRRVWWAINEAPGTIKEAAVDVANSTKEKAKVAANSAKETGKKAVNATDKFLSKSPDLVKINKSSPDIFGGKFRLTKAGALGAVVAGSLFAVKDFGESYYREPVSAGSATPLISSPVINAVQSSSSGLTPKNAMDNMGASGDLNFALRERNRLAPGQL